MFKAIAALFVLGSAIYFVASPYSQIKPVEMPVPSTSKPITQVMTVKQAYDAIPHLQVTFDASKASSMPANEAAYLHQLFTLVDLAVVERIETQLYMMGKGGADNQNHMEILRQLQALNPPEKLKETHEMVVSAIYEQKIYFDAWRKNRSLVISRTNPNIQSISQKLVKAYGLYMSLYPNENAHNKNSFYQHLCALDFV